jgi:hypothetical protein
MKNVLKTIAMILVVVILSNSITGCVLIGGGGYSQFYPFHRWALAFDLILLGTLILSVISFGIGRALAQGDAETPQMAVNPQEEPSSASSGNRTYVFSDQVEQIPFMETLNTLPRTQIDTLTLKVQAVPEAEKNSFVETLNAIPQTSMIPVMDELNALSEAELYDTVGYLNSLSETQFLALLKNIQDNAAYAGAQ